MSNYFVGRRRELEVLESAYRAGTSGFIPVYGRRRVGKSELILHFLGDKPGLYHVGKQAPEGLQLREWLGEAARVLDEPLLATMAADGWKTALLAVTRRWRRRSRWSSPSTSFSGPRGPLPRCRRSCRNFGIDTGSARETFC